MEWNAQNEAELLNLKKEGKTYQEIAKILGATISSVKHKYTRLNQKNNKDDYHHPQEKTAQIIECLRKIDGEIHVLETHAGYGNLTSVYGLYADDVLSYETDKKKHEYINRIGHDNVTCEKANSLLEIHRAIYFGLKFNVVDIDPYGFPSHYFPDVFELVDDGYIFVTVPKYGGSQINNITKMHVKTFYGFDGGDNGKFLECCIETFKKQALRTYRVVHVESIIDLKKVYRIALRVKRENAYILCGYPHLAKSMGGESS